MNRTTLPLAALLLTASLLSCAPTVQGPIGGYRPNVVTGVAYSLAMKIPVAQITEATPDATYATFDDCARVAVSVSDVRKLGVEMADQVCRDTVAGVGDVLQNLAVFGTVFGVFFIGFLVYFFQSLTAGFGRFVGGPDGSGAR